MKHQEGLENEKSGLTLTHCCPKKRNIFIVQLRDWAELKQSRTISALFSTVNTWVNFPQSVILFFQYLWDWEKNREKMERDLEKKKQEVLKDQEAKAKARKESRLKVNALLHSENDDETPDPRHVSNYS